MSICLSTNISHTCMQVLSTKLTLLTTMPLMWMLVCTGNTSPEECSCNMASVGDTWTAETWSKKQQCHITSSTNTVNYSTCNKKTIHLEIFSLSFPAVFLLFPLSLDVHVIYLILLASVLGYIWKITPHKLQSAVILYTYVNPTYTCTWH